MYKPRYIKFTELLLHDDWRIKSYTISDKEHFTSIKTYTKAVAQMPDWLGQLNSFDSRHENMAFLIVHEGSEGVFALINTWVGRNMLQSHVFLAKYTDPESFTKISGDGLFACVWELEIMHYERTSWTNHILKNPDHPDYLSYLNDRLFARI